jgi:EEF1A lysine methyltransferase 4
LLNPNHLDTGTASTAPVVPTAYPGTRPPQPPLKMHRPQNATAAHAPSTNTMKSKLHHRTYSTGTYSSTLKPSYFTKDIPSKQQSRVLILGCGNSTFGYDMIQDGYHQVVNVDFSSVVIEQMNQKYLTSNSNSTTIENVTTDDAGKLDQHQQPPWGNERLQFRCVDITKGLPFDDESFDLVICKGTMDAILSSGAGTGCVRRIVADIVRVLQRGHGMFVLVSHANEDQRLLYLEHPMTENLLWYWDAVKCVQVPRVVAASSSSNSVSSYRTMPNMYVIDVSCS